MMNSYTRNFAKNRITVISTKDPVTTIRRRPWWFSMLASYLTQWLVRPVAYAVTSSTTTDTAA